MIHHLPPEIFAVQAGAEARGLIESFRLVRDGWFRAIGTTRSLRERLSWKPKEVANARNAKDLDCTHSFSRRCEIKMRVKMAVSKGFSRARHHVPDTRTQARRVRHLKKMAHRAQRRAFRLFDGSAKATERDII